MNVLERETISNFLEGGCIESLTNKVVNMITDKQYTIKDGSVNSNYLRVICVEEYEWDYQNDEPVLISKVYKLQIKIYGFLLSKYHTIKEWSFDINDEAEDTLAKNDAIELFNNIINPYKYYG